MIFRTNNNSMNTTKKKPRVREKVIEMGLTFPTNTELIMLLLGSGIKGIPIRQLSKEVLNTISFSNNENLLQNLLKIDGIGISKAVTIAAALEFGRRQNLHRGQRILKPKDIISFVNYLAIEKQEHFICVTLSGAQEIIKIHTVSMGTVNKTLVHPREVFTKAIQDMAAAIIVCHNHPSGNVAPSEDDIETTNRLAEAASCLGIKLLDHIIIGTTDYFSFKENSLIS